MSMRDYIRIGTVYYKYVQRPLVGGKFTIGLLPWSVECIKQDHGKSFLSSIPKYDGFCFVPCHLDYKREIGRFYNSYHPFPHEPQPGYPKVALLFLNHVFGEQLDLGLDYLYRNVWPPSCSAIGNAIEHALSMGRPFEV